MGFLKFFICLIVIGWIFVTIYSLGFKDGTESKAEKPDGYIVVNQNNVKKDTITIQCSIPVIDIPKHKYILLEVVNEEE